MKNHLRKFNHETAHNQLIPVQYNVMCIDRAKVKIILYSGRFKENSGILPSIQSELYIIIRKYVYGRFKDIFHIHTYGSLHYNTFFSDFILAKICPEYLIYADFFTSITCPC